jgi:hypothetical protein
MRCRPRHCITAPAPRAASLFVDPDFVTTDLSPEGKP